MNEEIDIIKILEGVKGLTIKCNHCGGAFGAKNAHLFDIRKKPYPGYVLNKLDQQRDNIKKAFKKTEKEEETWLKKIEDIKEKIKKLKHRKIERPKRVQVITKYTNIGQIFDQILPASNKFRFENGDCRAILNPIDYISFGGLTKKGKVEKISFIEAKTGSQPLSRTQHQVKERVKEAGEGKSTINLIPY